jgi:hypothetical protein
VASSLIEPSPAPGARRIHVPSWSVGSQAYASVASLSQVPVPIGFQPTYWDPSSISLAWVANQAMVEGYSCTTPMSWLPMAPPM